MYTPGGWGSRWRLAWFLVLALLLFFFAARSAYPQDSTESKQRQLLNELQQRLTSIRDDSIKLEAMLKDSQISLSESRQQVEQLSSELSALRLELESWQDISASLQQQALGMLISLGELQERLRLLSEFSQNSEQLWGKALDEAQREVRRAKRRGVVVAIIAAVVGGGIGYAIGK